MTPLRRTGTAGSASATRAWCLRRICGRASSTWDSLEIMKSFFLALILTAAAAAAPRAADVPMTKLAWMTGDWQQTSGSRVIEEHWSTPSANTLIGMSRTVRDGRTVSFEFLRIEQRGNGTFYVAQPNGRPPTDFKLASWTDAELVFEGDGTDRVKRITYRKQGLNGLAATVEGEENGKTFRQEFRYSKAAAVIRPLTEGSR